MKQPNANPNNTKLSPHFKAEKPSKIERTFNAAISKKIQSVVQDNIMDHTAPPGVGPLCPQVWWCTVICLVVEQQLPNVLPHN